MAPVSSYMITGLPKVQDIHGPREQYLVKTSWLISAFVYCTCLLTFSLSYCIHLARDKRAVRMCRPTNFQCKISHTSHPWSHRLGSRTDPCSPFLKPQTTGVIRSPFCWSYTLLLCVAAQTGGTKQTHR